MPAARRREVKPNMFAFGKVDFSSRYGYKSSREKIIETAVTYIVDNDNEGNFLEADSFYVVSLEQAVINRVLPNGKMIPVRRVFHVFMDFGNYEVIDSSKTL